MEEEEKEALNEKRPRKLDFNAPILSTRQQNMGVANAKLSRANSQVAASWDACNRIPFSWEQIPGKPKDLEMIDTPDVEVPTPKLPPGRWHLSKEPFSANSQVASCDTCNRVPFSWEQIPGKPKDMEMIDCPDVDVPTPRLPPDRWQLSKESFNEGISEQQCDYDDGCDADVEDEYLDDNDDDDGKDGISSYAIDIFSLGESSDAMDMVDQRHDKAETTRTADSEQQPGGVHSPSFIIKRFLPDARALAASSLHTASNVLDKNVADSSSCTTICIKKPYSSSKSCGLNFFFPWRMKPKPCGGKNTVQATTPPRMAPQLCVRHISNRSQAKSPRANAS